MGTRQGGLWLLAGRAGGRRALGSGALRQGDKGGVRMGWGEAGPGCCVVGHKAGVRLLGAFPSTQLATRGLSTAVQTAGRRMQQHPQLAVHQTNTKPPTRCAPEGAPASRVGHSTWHALRGYVQSDWVGRG